MHWELPNWLTQTTLCYTKIARIFETTTYKPVVFNNLHNYIVREPMEICLELWVQKVWGLEYDGIQHGTLKRAFLNFISHLKYLLKVPQNSSLISMIEYMNETSAKMFS